MEIENILNEYWQPLKILIKEKTREDGKNVW